MTFSSHGVAFFAVSVLFFFVFVFFVFVFAERLAPSSVVRISPSTHSNPPARSTIPSSIIIRLASSINTSCAAHARRNASPVTSPPSASGCVALARARNAILISVGVASLATPSSSYGDRGPTVRIFTVRSLARRASTRRARSAAASNASSSPREKADVAAGTTDRRAMRGRWGARRTTRATG